MAGSSIPYPVNFLINFFVILLFIVVILAIAWYRYYKSQAVRRRRQMLTGTHGLSMDMTGVKGRYPPKKIERLLKLKLQKMLREAEAAEREYVIDSHEARSMSVSPLPEKSELKSDETRRSVMAHKPSVSDGPKNAPVADIAVPTLMLPDEQAADTELNEADVGSAHGSEVAERDVGQSQNNATKQRVVRGMTSKPSGSDGPKTAPVADSAVPTFVLSVEQAADTEVNEADDGSAQGSEVTERDVGQSQNNATKQRTEKHSEQHSLPAEVESATKASTATQTSPRDQSDTEQNASSEGSFDDSVMSL